MSREHYDACFRYGIKSSPDEKCNCHEFDKALEWTMPYIFSTLREKVEKEIDYFCEVMHITYETAAIEEGWRTQEITRGEWENSPESNKETMRKSVRAVLLSLLTEIEGEMK